MSTVRLYLNRVIYVLVTSLLRVPWISFFLSSVRFFYFRTILRRRLTAWDPDSSLTINFDYSKSAYAKTLIRPLTRSVIPISLASSLLWPEPFDKKILIIGPRYESDYFIARGYGFQKSNISLLDHFSYSKLITVGDAHHLEYDTSTFDIVIASWVLVYSINHAQMLSEIRRVLKPNTGIGIVTGDYGVIPNSYDATDKSINSYTFNADHISKIWPGKNDMSIVSWPSKCPVINSSAQVIFAVQKNSD
jgi:hypothetical protein